MSVAASTLPPPRHGHVARHRGESAYPELWDSLIYGWMPSLGYSGDVLRDMRPGGRNLTLSNGNTWGINSLPPPHGQRGEAPIFNGTSHYAASESPLYLGETARLTVAFWLYLDSYGSLKIAIESSANYNGNTHAFLFNPDTTDFGGAHAVLALKVSGDAYPTGYNIVLVPRPSAAEWHHWMIVMDRQGGANQFAAVYVDGVPQTITATEAAGTASGHFGVHTWFFMSREGGSAFTPGRLGDCFIWKRLLDQREAMLLHGGATPLHRCEPVLANSQYQHWARCLAMLGVGN